MNEQPQPTVPSVNQPQMPIPPNSNKSKRRIILVGLVLLGLVLIVSIVFLSTRGVKESANSNNSAQEKPSFKNYLAPTKELKVGSYRYVSPCQIFPKDDAQKLGGFTNETAISESYIDSDYNTSKTYLPLKTQCGYMLKSSQYKSAYVYADQYVDAIHAKRLDSSVTAQPDKLKSTIADYTTIATGNAEAEQFVKRLKDSLPRYEQNIKISYNKAELAKSNTDGIVLPHSSDQFNYFNENIVYTFDIDSSSTKSMTAERLAAYNLMLNSIEKHLVNKSLDQSPAPTILGDTDMVGPTKVLEPCSLLSSQVFNQITGATPLGPIDRISLPQGIEKISSATDKDFVTNYCERASEIESSGVKVSTRISLSLRYARSEESAIKWLKEGERTTPLQTSADQAFVLNPRFDGDIPLFYFRVGRYIGEVGYTQTRSSTLSAPIKTSDVSNEEHVKAMNLLITEIRKTL